MNETMDEQHSPTSLCNVHGVLCEAEAIYLYVMKNEGVFNSVKVRGRCVPAANFIIDTQRCRPNILAAQVHMMN